MVKKYFIKTYKVCQCSMLDSNKILKDMKNLISEYIKCWETQGTKFIKIGPGVDRSSLVIENNLTPCEANYLIFVKIENNQFVFRYHIEDLPYEVMLHIPVFLTEQLKTIQTANYDHKIFWSWMGQIILQIQSSYNSIIEQETLYLIELLLHLELSSLSRLPINEYVQQLNQIINMVVNPHTQEAIINKHILSLALGFPTLERLLRVLCSNFVDINGNVITEFILNENKKTYKKGKRISNIAVLLRLYEEKIATKEQRKILEEFKSIIASFSEKAMDPYDLIYEWRNDILHGGRPYQNKHSVITNLILLLLLFKLDKVYDKIREEVKKSISLPYYSHYFNFYPPDILG